MEDIYISSISPDGTHQCIIECDSHTVWMYLHDLEQSCILSDAPICSLIEPITSEEFNDIYKGEGAPPLVKKYSTDSSIVPDIINQRLSVKWANDGLSVVAFVDNKPFSMIIHDIKNGYSKSICRKGPWGNPWDDKLYTDNFG